jgi:hypothetical protein
MGEALTNRPTSFVSDSGVAAVKALLLAVQLSARKSPFSFRKNWLYNSARVIEMACLLLLLTNSGGIMYNTSCAFIRMYTILVIHIVDNIRSSRGSGGIFFSEGDSFCEFSLPFIFAIQILHTR